MVMSVSAEQHRPAAAPLDLRTTHRERGSSPGSSATGGSPAPPARTGTEAPDRLGRRDSSAPLTLPFRKRKIPVEPETSVDRDSSPRAPPFWSPVPHYGPVCLPPEPVGPVLLSSVTLAMRQDEDGDTPLHIAVVQGKIAVVYKLLEIFLFEYKSPDLYNNLRQTPLHLAVITQQPDMVEVLLKAGADPSALDRNGRTALHLCCEYDQAHCLSLLLSLRSSAACLEIRNYEGMSPLHLAVLHSHKHLATMLLNAGADINGMDNKSGQSPLMLAVEGNNVNMVHFLVENGCDVNSQSYSRNTALHCACGRGQVDTVRLLLKHGADSGLKNYHNDTPVMLTNNKKIADVIRGRSSKQVRVPDQIYVGTSSTQRQRFADTGHPSPYQRHGSCSPSSLSMSQQTHLQSPKTGVLFSSQPLTASANSPGNMYPPIRMDYEA